jgi:hypothetical protein
MSVGLLKWAKVVLAGLCMGATLAAWGQQPSEAQLREDYGRWVLTLGSYEYRARHILTSKPETAATLLRDLQSGGSFAKLAAEHSLDPGSKAKGGDLGWVLPVYFVPSFRVAFRNMETGLHPAVIRTEFGWHVVEVLEVRQVRVPRFEEVREQIAQDWRKRNPSTAPTTEPQTAARNRPSSDWQTLYIAALQTAGEYSYEYFEAITTDYEKAQHTQRVGTSVVPRKRHKARHLIDVPPAHRYAITDLYSEGDTSPPLERVRADGSKEWTVLELIKSDKAVKLSPGAGFERDTELWIAEGKLQDVAALRTPKEMAKSAYWLNHRLVDWDKIDPALSADVEYDNQSTPLLDAILGNQLELAKRLVQRGADINRCGSWGCPIGLAASLGPESRALTWVDWLLTQNVKLDQLDARDPGRTSVALARALFAGHNAVAQRLLDAGASVNGAPDASLTPAEAAAAKYNKAMVEKLVVAGASVQPRSSTRGFGMKSIYAMQLTDEGKSLRPWAEQLILKQASVHPDYKLAVQFEQNGRVVPADAKGVVVLKAAPFKLVFSIPATQDGVQIGASLEPEWIDEIKRVEPRNSMFRPMSSGALQETDKPKSAYVLISRPCPKAERAVDEDKGCDEGYAMHLHTNPNDRKDFHETRAGSPQRYVRDVDHFAGLVDKNMAKNTDRDAPVSEMKGKTVYFVAGPALNMGGVSGLRLVNAQYFQLKFQ